MEHNQIQATEGLTEGKREIIKRLNGVEEHVRLLMGGEERFHVTLLMRAIVAFDCSF
uniref:AKAP7_NLS domain-containing protein n=1 Tax=Meloidogyne hapla TaxID=6305 RepID=A0A1I8BWF7_MELHA